MRIYFDTTKREEKTFKLLLENDYVPNGYTRENMINLDFILNYYRSFPILRLYTISKEIGGNYKYMMNDAIKRKINNVLNKDEIICETLEDLKEKLYLYNKLGI